MPHGDRPAADRCPDQHQEKERQLAYLGMIRKGFIGKDAAERAGVPAEELTAWKRSAQFNERVRAARREFRDATLALVLAEIEVGRSPQPVLAARNCSSGWLYALERDDPDVAWAVRAAREKAQEERDRQAAVRRASAAEETRKIRQEASRAAVTARYREHVARLVPLLENGATVREAITEIGISAQSLTNIRRRLPGAEQTIRDAYERGEQARAARLATVNRGATAHTNVHVQAEKLIVAAVARGMTLDEACTAGGVVPGWVVQRYHRIDAFR
jgi:hypothetical protein